MATPLIIAIATLVTSLVNAIALFFHIKQTSPPVALPLSVHASADPVVPTK
jgi:hypothetical protein